MIEALLKVVNISKSFGTLPALRQVSFELFPGEIVGLAGRSGAGKSVLAMLLAGLFQADAGETFFGGQRLQWPFHPRAHGIEIIHQHPDLADHLDITANILLGNEIGWPASARWLRVPNQRRMDQLALRILARLDVRFSSLRERVSNLSSEQRQIIAIARAMVRPARLVVVDEPTTLLSYGYQQKVLSLIQDWQRQGSSVLFCSNNLEHLFAVTDRIIVLRQGRRVADVRTDRTSREEIVNALVGTSDREQLTPMIWALDSYYRAREQAEKLHHQEMLLKQNLAVQDTLNRALVEQLAQQVRALDQANLALQDAHRRLLTQREEERKHLARELHDQVIQDLLSINYQLEDIAVVAEAERNSAEEIAEIRGGIRGLIDDLRRICGSLRPPTIDSLGLGAALQSHIRDWSARTGIPVGLQLDPDFGRLPEAIELSIFRIVQEGLHNVRKHAEASSVEVSLVNTSPRTLMVSIADDGRGLPEAFDLASCLAQGHYGLVGVSERVALLSGRLSLQNRPAGGVLLQVEIPHPRQDAHGGQESPAPAAALTSAPRAGAQQ